MKTINPKDLSPVEIQGYLQNAIGPRPIAFASTVNKDGQANLSPFSFFNLFSSNPPILIFSPARRVRNNTTKHTLQNVIETKEVVINIVNYAMVQQQSLASTEYGDGIDEFIKSGFTKLASENVKPWRVAESPVQLECKVNEVVALGNQGGAGNLVICEVVKMHISEEILTENGNIDPHKIDLVARMGGNWYTRAADGMFEVEKPLTTLGIGVDAIPEKAINSGVFSGNDLGILGNIEQIPTADEIQAFVNNSSQLQSWMNDNNHLEVYNHAKQLIAKQEVTNAWKTILAIESK